MLIKDYAICIRVIDYSETSQIVTFFTKTAGKISAIAKVDTLEVGIQRFYRSFFYRHDCFYSIDRWQSCHSYRIRTGVPFHQSG